MNGHPIKRREFFRGAAALGSLGMSGILADPVIGTRSVGQLPARSEFVVRNAYVMTMDSALGDLANSDLHVRDGEIVAVGTRLIAPTAKNIDGRNTIVLPGLIDTHWHLWTSLFRSLSGDTKERGYFPLSKRLGKAYTPEDMYRVVLQRSRREVVE